MNRIISDTAEYGCYLFDHACKPMLEDFFKKIESKHIGSKYNLTDDFDNADLIKVNDVIRNHPVETIGKKLRLSMTSMKKIV